MEPVIGWLESECCGNLLLALAHTLWQGALIAGILYLHLRRTPAQAADRRYIAAAAALVVVVLSGLLTWSILNYEPAPAQSDVAAASVAVDSPIVTAPLPAEQPTSAPEVRAVFRSSRSRQTWLMGAWLAGVGAMLLRMAAMVVGGNRLRMQCRPMENAETLEFIEQLRARMGIGRRIRTLVGERISTPGVIGCFWPTLLLPASMLSGIPADDLQAILVHELAHIRRYDYLINFLQMVVEALLFFNPAVWWISRQIRIEREACCDAAGVRWIGQRDRYAEALVAWAHRIGTPAPAVGFSEDTDRGTLLDRVRRILVAGHQPRPRVPWHVAAAMLVLSLACLVLLGQATGLAVNLAGRILTPQERVDAIADISKEYGRDNRRYGPEDNVRISGVVRTYDGGPLPERADLQLSSREHFYFTGVAAKGSNEGVFDQIVAFGRIRVMASAKGYAPAVAGPFDPEPGGHVDGIELVLGRGFSGRIQVVDEMGLPIQNTRLTGGYTYPDSYSFANTIELVTDANGIATLDHAAAEKIMLQIHADEFEPQQATEFVLASDEITTVVLRRSQPVAGIVIDEATGQPIEGAELRILATVQGGHSRHNDSVDRPAQTVTDAQGRFVLRQLQRDRRHLLFVRAAGYGYRYIPDVTTTSRELTVALGPRKIIRGRITGDLSLLATDSKSGRPIIGVGNSYRYPETSGYVDANGKSPVAIRDGVGYFEIEDFWGQTVTLTAGLEQVRLNVERDRLDDVAIDLRPVARRQIILRFQVPQDAPPIEGDVRVSYISERARQQRQDPTFDLLDITANQASCEVPAPGTFSYNIDFYQGKRPVGYWFDGVWGFRVEQDAAPLTIDVPVQSAGAIYGRVLRYDGTLAEEASASLLVVKRPRIENGQASSLSSLQDALSKGVDRGTFNATPLPLGGQYAVLVHEDSTYAVSDVFTLDEKNPIVNIDLTLPQGVDLEGQILDENGIPSRREVSLHVSVKRGDHSGGQSGPPIQPDAAGRFVFKNVNPSAAGKCFIEIAGGQGYRPVHQEIKSLRSPVILRLEKGRSVSGTVVEDAGGRPVPNAEVFAWSAEGPSGGHRRNAELLEADGRTDAEGRFTFSDMTDDYYTLGVRSANLADARHAVVVKGGQKEPATIRIVIPEGSPLTRGAP